MNQKFECCECRRTFEVKIQKAVPKLMNQPENEYAKHEFGYLCPDCQQDKRRQAMTLTGSGSATIAQ